MPKKSLCRCGHWEVEHEKNKPCCDCRCFEFWAYLDTPEEDPS